MSVRRTIFERYGGFANVSKVVMDFYDKILDSPVTSPFFANTDMKRLIDHQTKFIATIMGGPASYSNEHVEKVHERLGITEVAFLEAMELLRETLEDHNFQEDDIETVEDEMMSYKNFVVARR
jgi:hemoglobin